MIAQTGFVRWTGMRGLKTTATGRKATTRPGDLKRNFTIAAIATPQIRRRRTV